MASQHEREESNPVKQFWRLPALPGAHSCDTRGNGRARVSEGSRTRASWFTARRAEPLHHGHHERNVEGPISSSTRIRTRNTSFEARDDLRFTIELCLRLKRKAWDSNPHDL